MSRDIFQFRGPRALSRARGRALVVGAAVGCLAVAGCSSAAGGASASSPAASNSKLVFYEVNNGCASDPFWAAVNNGANAAASKLGVTVKIVNPTNCESQAEENSLLTNVVNEKPAGIAISETSPTAFASNIQRARKLGIPTIAYNSIPPNNNTTQDPVQAFVGTDLYQSGVMWGQENIKDYHLTKGDLVPVIDVCAPNIACNTIYRGFQSAVQAVGVSAPIVAVTQDVAQTTTVVHSYLATHPKVKAIAAMVNPDGVVAALKELNRKPGQIPMSTYNVNGKDPQYMQQGWLDFAINQVPFLQGYDSVIDLYTAAQHHQPPVNIQTGPVVVRSSDKALLTPTMVNNTGL